MAKRMAAADRRRQLLEVAAKVFADRGYHGATTAQLARAAGITEPILYRHFRNKLDLFVTLLEDVGDQVIDAWRTSLEQVEDPHERLEVLLDGNPATHGEGRGIYRVIFQAMTEAENDPDIRAALKKHVTRLHRFLAAELESLSESGVVRADVDASALAFMMVNVAVGFGMLRPLGIPKHSTEAGRRAVQELLADALNAE